MKCVIIILTRGQQELQGRRLRQAVINIVKRRLVNVHLILPARALFQIGNALRREIGAVFCLQPIPRFLAFCGRKRRIVVYDMLELVHHTAVGNEGEGIQKVL